MTDPRLAGVNPQNICIYIYLADPGAWWAPPAAAYIAEVSLEGLGPGWIRSGLDQGAERNLLRVLCWPMTDPEISVADQWMGFSSVGSGLDQGVKRKDQRCVCVCVT